MARTRGAKGKNQISKREQYWRAVLGIDRTTSDVKRRRKFLAKKEQAAEDAVRAIELEKKLAALPPDDGSTPRLMARVMQRELTRIRTGETVADSVDPDPLYREFGGNIHRNRAEAPIKEKRRAAEQKRSEEWALAWVKAERERWMREWVSRIDEVMELRKRLKQSAKQK
jgi:hypothetical protein